MVYKQGNIVTITYPNDVQGNIPRGEIGVVFTLPAEYRPKYSMIAFTGPVTNIQIQIYTNGEIFLYNYGNDITGLISARFTLTYLTA